MILDDGEWVSYATPLSITELASHILYYYSVDKVGNIETTKNISFINKKSVLDISMKTDFNLGIQVTIKNNAVQTLTNLQWSYQNQVPILFGTLKNGTITSLSPEMAEPTVKWLPIGLGKGKIRCEVFITDHRTERIE